GIESVDCDAEIPCGWANYPGGVRIMTASTLRSVMVYDLSGRLKMTIPSVANNDIIPLPYGVYFITAPGLTTPMRVIVEP
ncbi:MAG: T9SS type A sorting domain-containing protein, partial [Muribaculaceae bacterium]|nr:T9SS type A sorting domain-containing protein [Muribaculaceae bacterium]